MVKADELTDKKVLILGLARQGVAMARFAVEIGARVIVSDIRGDHVLNLVSQFTEFLDDFVHVALFVALHCHRDPIQYHHGHQGQKNHESQYRAYHCSNTINIISNLFDVLTSF